MKLSATIVLHGLSPSTGPSISVGASDVAPGTPIHITVSKGPANRGDWIGLSNAGSPDGSVIAWVYLSGTQTPPPAGLASAIVVMPAPATVGNYQARLYCCDIFSVLARSAFAVGTDVPPPPPPPGQPTDIIITPVALTLSDTSVAGTVVARVSVPMSDGSVFAGSLSSSDPLFIFHGLDLVTSRALAAADGGTHHTTLTAIQNGLSVSVRLAMSKS